jgi:hypothetical protein
MDMSVRHSGRPGLKRPMSFEDPNRRIIEPESLPGGPSVSLDQPTSAQRAPTRLAAPETPLDLGAMGKLQALFELLDRWDQQEQTNEK